MADQPKWPSYAISGQGLSLDFDGKLPPNVASTIPGFEIAYAEFKAPVTANTVAETAATQIVTAGSVNFDGAMSVWIEFYAPSLVWGGAATTSTGINLWDGSTDLGRFYDATTVAQPVMNIGACFKRKVTPTAGAHTYSARIWSTTAVNFVVEAGVGGAGVRLPGYIKITRA